MTRWNKVLLQKLTADQPIKKFPAFDGSCMLITAVKTPLFSPNPNRLNVVKIIIFSYARYTLN
jgi:hypothetical protein